MNKCVDVNLMQEKGRGKEVWTRTFSLILFCLSFHLSNIPLCEKRQRRIGARERERRIERASEREMASKDRVKKPKSLLCLLWSAPHLSMFDTRLPDRSKVCHRLIGELLHPLIQCSKVLLYSPQIFLHCLLDLWEKTGCAGRCQFINNKDIFKIYIFYFTLGKNIHWSQLLKSKYLLPFSFISCHVLNIVGQANKN